MACGVLCYIIENTLLLNLFFFFLLVCASVGPPVQQTDKTEGGDRKWTEKNTH